MIRQGTIIDNPKTGERIEFRKTADETGGERIKFDYFLRPGGFAVGKVDHVHPWQEERFEVQEGRLGVRIDGDEWTATPGSRFAVLPKTPHTVWNDGSSVMHAVVEIRPALDIETFFETTYALAQDGKTNSLGLPNPLHLAVIADAFQDEFTFGMIPEPLQQALVAMLAPVGRLAGYRAFYPYDDEAETADAKSPLGRM